MKKAIGVLAVLGITSAASAELILHEGFDYPASGNPVLGAASTAAADKGVWTSQGNVNNTVRVRVTAGSLTYPGLPASVGNSAKLDNNNGQATGADASRLYLGSVSGPTLYYSFIVSLPSYAETGTTATSNGAYLAGFDNATTGASYLSAAGLWVRTDAADANRLNLGISNSGSQNKVFASASLESNKPIFVVASFTFSGVATLDVFSDNAAISSSEPSTHSAVTSGVESATVASITNFFLRGNVSEPQGIVVDELRIGTTWADVAAVPEPASVIGLLGFGGVGLLRCRRR